ncbi:hypothetical protein MUK42_33772 [Musa troglodytarum]|uniref:Uncharacterized protein n=1 Tax=Musa troglodytarum TaxID=320322 RepID=A0A9E7EE12_9LILI|nr:hypothetical protein MUK42_33772 [Musa troglodytarum]
MPWHRKNPGKRKDQIEIRPVSRENSFASIFLGKREIDHENPTYRMASQQEPLLDYPVAADFLYSLTRTRAGAGHSQQHPLQVKNKPTMGLDQMMQSLNEGWLRGMLGLHSGVRVRWDESKIPPVDVDEKDGVKFLSRGPVPEYLLCQLRGFGEAQVRVGHQLNKYKKELPVGLAEFQTGEEHLISLFPPHNNTVPGIGHSVFPFARAADRMQVVHSIPASSDSAVCLSAWRFNRSSSGKKIVVLLTLTPLKTKNEFDLYLLSLILPPLPLLRLLILPQRRLVQKLGLGSNHFFTERMGLELGKSGEARVTKIGRVGPSDRVSSGPLSTNEILQ